MQMQNPNVDEVLSEEEQALFVKALRNTKGKLTDEMVNDYLAWVADTVNLARAFEGVLNGIFTIDVEEGGYTFNFTDKGKEELEAFKRNLDRGTN